MIMDWQQHLARAASSVDSARDLILSAGSGSEAGEQAVLDALRLLESASEACRWAAMTMRVARKVTA